MLLSELKHLLASQHVFWNLDPDKLSSYSDETVIEYALMRADLPELHQLFKIFKKEKIKQVWLDRLAVDQFQYKNNYFLAYLFFDIDNPSDFLKTYYSQNNRLEKLKRIADQDKRSFGNAQPI